MAPRTPAASQRARRLTGSSTSGSTAPSRPAASSTACWVQRIRNAAASVPHSVMATTPDQLFFPTVHIHDGKVHPRERFDHSLFLQADVEEDKPLRGWMESPKLASAFMNVKKSKELVTAKEHCYWRRVRGMRANTDITV